MNNQEIIEAKSIEIQRLHKVCENYKSDISILSEHIDYILSIINDDVITPQYRKQLHDLIQYYK